MLHDSRGRQAMRLREVQWMLLDLQTEQTLKPRARLKSPMRALLSNTWRAKTMATAVRPPPPELNVTTYDAPQNCVSDSVVIPLKYGAPAPLARYGYGFASDLRYQQWYFFGRLLHRRHIAPLFILVFVLPRLHRAHREEKGIYLGLCFRILARHRRHIFALHSRVFHSDPHSTVLALLARNG